MDDREKLGMLMDDISTLCSDAHLPSVMILGVLEAVKFEILSQAMDGAKPQLMQGMMKKSEKIEVE